VNSLLIEISWFFNKTVVDKIKLLTRKMCGVFSKKQKKKKKTNSFLLLIEMLKKWSPTRALTTLEQRTHSKHATPRSIAENTARVGQNPPKEKQAVFEQNIEFHVSTSQNPRFLPGTLYFSTFYLKDLAKIFLLMRFEKILNTKSS